MSVKAKAPSAKPAWWSRFARSTRDRDRMLPLYHAVVERARDPFWYRDCQVPDTVDGRFDMLAAMMALLLIRYEREPGDEAKQDSVLLAETFIEDMDESLHQIGIGDYVVGKHIGRMMGALGGRLTAFRQAQQEGDFGSAVHRNIFHEAPPADDPVVLVASRLASFDRALAATPISAITAGRLPAL